MIYARFIVKWTHKSVETYIFSNIVKTDVSFYDDLFWSRPGYADFNLTFGYIPIKQSSYPNDEVGKFSQWWHSLYKNNMPTMVIELFDVITAETITNGTVYSWEENCEDFEVAFTCIDELSNLLDVTVSRNALTKNSASIEAVKQPFGPTVPPDTEDGLPPIIPPSLPTISYQDTINEFLWSAIDEWWNSIRGDVPALVKPLSSPPFVYGLGILNNISGAINTKLQSLSSGEFRVQIKFRSLSNIARKDILSDLSIHTRSKIICQNGIRFIANLPTIHITGYVKSINSNDSTQEITADRIIDSLILQKLTYNANNENYYWANNQIFTNTVRDNRNIYLQSQITPRTEYNVWGYTDSSFAGILQAGYTIRLDNEIYRIKEISYESETMHNLKSFEAVCIKI